MTFFVGFGGNPHVGRIHFTGEDGQLKRLKLTRDPNDKTKCLMETSPFRVQNLQKKHFMSDQAMNNYFKDANKLPTVSVNCKTDPIPDKPLRDAYNVMNDAYYFVYHSLRMFNRYNLTVTNKKLDVWVNFTETTGGNAAAFLNYIVINNGGRRFYPLTSYPDVLAHELGHTFTRSHSDLEYREESGGMNEAYSDMCGIAFKHHLHDDYNWIVGEKAFRSDTAPNGLR